MIWTHKGHEFDEIGAIFQKNSDLYIWGATAEAADFAVRARALELPVRIMEDNLRWRYSGWGGLDVVPPAQVLRAPEGKTILVALCGTAADDAFAQLEVAGFQRNVSYFQVDEFVEKWLSIYAVYVSGKVYFKDISFIPSTKCNLNCEKCLNFTPFLKKMEDESLEELKKSVDLFFSRVDYIGLFHVSGGEPILYPHFEELLAYIDIRYRSQIHQIATTTNGTIEFSDQVCRTLRRHRIVLICDDYTDALPENRDFFDALLTRLERKGISFYKNKAETWIDLAPERTDHSNMSREELIQHRSACALPFQEFHGGRLYACNYAHYAEKARLTVCGPDEYLDFASLTGDWQKELVEFRLGYTEKGYVEFCKHCAGFFNNPYQCPPAKQAERKKFEGDQG